MIEYFGAKYIIRITDQTRCRKYGFGPVNVRKLFKFRPNIEITADLSHLVCFTESFLEDFVDDAIRKVEHYQERVGFNEGEQVPDPVGPFQKLTVR